MSLSTPLWGQLIPTDWGEGNPLVVPYSSGLTPSPLVHIYDLVIWFGPGFSPSHIHDIIVLGCTLSTDPEISTSLSIGAEEGTILMVSPVLPVSLWSRWSNATSVFSFSTVVRWSIVHSFWPPPHPPFYHAGRCRFNMPKRRISLFGSTMRTR